MQGGHKAAGVCGGCAWGVTHCWGGGMWYHLAYLQPLVPGPLLHSLSPWGSLRPWPWHCTLTRCAMQGDQGGERVLQRRWTTFLKAQLLCSHPEDGFPFNVLQDIFVLTPGELRWRETLFYGVFTSQW